MLVVGLLTSVIKCVYMLMQQYLGVHVFSCAYVQEQLYIYVCQICMYVVYTCTPHCVHTTSIHIYAHQHCLHIHIFCRAQADTTKQTKNAITDIYGHVWQPCACFFWFVWSVWSTMVGVYMLMHQYM